MLLVSRMFFIKNVTFFSAPKLAVEIKEGLLQFLAQEPANSLFPNALTNLLSPCHLHIPVSHMAKKFSSPVPSFMASHNPCHEFHHALRHSFFQFSICIFLDVKCCNQVQEHIPSRILLYRYHLFHRTCHVYHPTMVQCM